ncbi:hypothetical protein GGX14DRAFT_406570 [Mycena pura]|uniref:Uncharacterized protein n=1 Tax=Mycena pura TaxID=153505 RepID=A0AAD6Y351_9AGAR|nr:hypothetical protein GGX14DRAFT_406570 [Mycena pura]
MTPPATHAAPSALHSRQQIERTEETPHPPPRRSCRMSITAYDTWPEPAASEPPPHASLSPPMLFMLFCITTRTDRRHGICTMLIEDRRRRAADNAAASGANVYVAPGTGMCSARMLNMLFVAEPAGLSASAPSRGDTSELKTRGCVVYYVMTAPPIMSMHEVAQPADIPLNYCGTFSRLVITLTSTLAIEDVQKGPELYTGTARAPLSGSLL